ncbi:beta-galactosidase [Capnocytophaga haemolytica]|uniref:Beta-galactosidase n=2 Tax=Capnocytophaga haemolytica TaxID=45243 RepID=A0AAX2H1W5_9FLAO|nr:beta-galactosidase [Capnocytophaga haemolytica]SNV16290.1 Beta-galactosidase [Capnocytophaga haemolytica]
MRHRILNILKMKRLLTTVLLGAALCGFAQSEQTLEKGWRFTREDKADFAAATFDDSSWQSVTVPHDWAIYGPFDIENDVQRTAIKQDGQVAPIAHSGRTGGLPFVGVGWYRTHFKVDDFEAGSGKSVFVQFDGAMSNPVVYVNGQRAGEWHNGYNTFFLEITPFIKQGDNTLAVRLENLTQQSRWYPGAGLYRNVHIIVKNDTYVPIWGVQITTPEVNKEFAKVKVKTEVELTPSFVTNPKNIKNTPIKVRTEIYAPDGKRIVSGEKSLDEYSIEGVEQELIVDKPALWDVGKPNLYKAVSIILEEDKVRDRVTTTFGIRSIELRPNDGLYLNGRKIQFKGVCLHHDLGPLGAAVNEAAIRRQIKIMQDMGANAIRTSHNMPAPEYVRIANEMGMMLAVESFDEWAIPKVDNGYHLYFKDWAKEDLRNLVKHYRNDPSVVLWFIGNEVEEQSVESGSQVARYLQDIVKKYDTTRPVCNGMDRPDDVMKNNMAATMQVAGFNYRPFKYEEAYKRLPQQLLLGSETASTLSSRGVYKFPVERKSMPKYDDQQTSSYDVEHCGWSNLPEDDWVHQDDLPYMLGEFVWTGFDYLGEPTPYYVEWPAHSSYFGAVDLAGLPKDRFYLYRSRWNKDKETLHILPHWNWEGREGETTPVFVYSNYPMVELFINGKSQGKRSKDTNVKIAGSDSEAAKKSFERQKRYRLMWMDTKYKPGTVKAVAYDEKGKKVATTEIHTAGKPYALRLTADRTQLKADGKDLAFITVEVVDKKGNVCPTPKDLVHFEVSGAGTYRAGANGDATCTDVFHLPQMHLFSGKAVAIVQAAEQAGKVVLKAKSEGLKSAEIVMNVQ